MASFMFIVVLVVLIAMFVFILRTWRTVRTIQEDSDQVVVPRGRDRSQEAYAPQSMGMSLEMVQELVRRQVESERYEQASEPARMQVVEPEIEKPAQGFGSISEGDLRRLLKAVQPGGDA